MRNVNLQATGFCVRVQDAKPKDERKSRKDRYSGEFREFERHVGVRRGYDRLRAMELEVQLEEIPIAQFAAFLLRHGIPRARLTIPQVFGMFVDVKVCFDNQK